jgi:ABC-type lipoprotein export system ATPase subunit
MSAVIAERRELASCLGVSVRHRRDGFEATALEDVDLSIVEGEALALQGPSGSGKTTLLHVLGGLLAPSAGDVRWRGEPISSLDVAARARARASGIGYVFQGSDLLPNFTAFENVAFAAWVAQRATGRSGGDPGELLQLVGLDHKRESLPSELSGGEAQRVAIARALAQRLQILLCDEPTGHLDSDTGRRVLDLIDALRERFGFALVVATHDRGVASRYPRTIGLRDGRVVREEVA